MLIRCINHSETNMTASESELRTGVCDVVFQLECWGRCFVADFKSQLPLGPMKEGGNNEK